VKLAVTIVRPGPELSGYVRRLAFALHNSNQIDDARTLYSECTKMEPNWQSTNLDIAWKLATSPTIAPGDAATAFELASEVVQASASPTARTLDVQAVSLATIGHFDEAVAVCRRALNQAAPEQASAIAERLVLYEKKKRYIMK
jgi:hypothetical protein